MKKIMLIAIGAMLACTSCNTVVPSLANQTFSLTELNGTALNADNEPAIAFNDSMVSATVGCNRINAMYKTGENGSLTLQQAASTRMMCPDNLRENEFIESLNKITRCTYEGEDVTLFGAEGNALIKAVKQ